MCTGLYKDSFYENWGLENKDSSVLIFDEVSPSDIIFKVFLPACKVGNEWKWTAHILKIPSRHYLKKYVLNFLTKLKLILFRFLQDYPRSIKILPHHKAVPVAWQHNHEVSLWISFVTKFQFKTGGLSSSSGLLTILLVVVLKGMPAYHSPGHLLRRLQDRPRCRRKYTHFLHGKEHKCGALILGVLMSYPATNVLACWLHQSGIPTSNSGTTLHNVLCVVEWVRDSHSDLLLGTMDIIDYVLQISIISY